MTQYSLDLTGQSGKTLSVNSAETGIEFTTVDLSNYYNKYEVTNYDNQYWTSGSTGINSIHSIGYNNATADYSAVLGGSANTVSHANSVIIGGTGLTSVSANTLHCSNMYNYGVTDLRGNLSVFGKAVSTLKTESFSSTITLDLSTRNAFQITVTSGITISASSFEDAQVITLNIIMDAIGGHTVILSSNFVDISGTSLIINTANAVNVLVGYCRNNKVYYEIKNLP